MRSRTVIVQAVLALATGPVFAQAMYRCGNSYGDQPCPGATLLPAAQPPSEADARQARLAAQQDQRLADAMEKARLEQQASAPKALIVGADAPAAPGVEKLQRSQKKKGKAPEHFTATVPQPPVADAEGGKKKRKKP